MTRIADHAARIEFRDRTSHGRLFVQWYLPILLTAGLAVTLLYAGLYASYAHPRVTATLANAERVFPSWDTSYANLSDTDAAHARAYPCTAIGKFGCDLISGLDVIRAVGAPTKIYDLIKPIVQTECVMDGDTARYTLVTSTPNSVAVTAHARCARARKATHNVSFMYAWHPAWDELVAKHTAGTVVVTEEMLRLTFTNSFHYYLAEPGLSCTSLMARGGISNYKPVGMLDTDAGVFTVYPSPPQTGWVYICSKSDAEFDVRVDESATYDVAYTVSHHGICLADQSGDKCASVRSKAFIVGHIGGAFLWLTLMMALIAVAVLLPFNRKMAAYPPTAQGVEAPLLPPRMPVMHYYRMHGIMITVSVFAVVALIFMVSSCIANVRADDMNCSRCSMSVGKGPTATYIGTTITAILTATALAVLSIYVTVMELW